jgi:hypothetical protein
VLVIEPIKKEFIHQTRSYLNKKNVNLLCLLKDLE